MKDHEIEAILKKAEQYGMAKVDEMNPFRFSEIQRKYFKDVEEFKQKLKRRDCKSKREQMGYANWAHDTVLAFMRRRGMIKNES